MTTWLLLLALPVMFLTGLVIGRHRPAPPRHQHIWAPWEQTTLHKVHPATGKELHTVSGQRRDCLDCGYRQVEEIDW